MKSDNSQFVALIDNENEVLKLFSLCGVAGIHNLSNPRCLMK